MNRDFIIRWLCALVVAIALFESPGSQAAFIPVYRGGICVADGSGACVGGDIRAEPGLGAQVGFMRTTSGADVIPVYQSTCYSNAAGTCNAFGLSLDVSGSPVGYVSLTAPDGASPALVQSNGLLLQNLGGTASAYLWSKRVVVTAVNGGTSPTAGTAFSVTVQAQDAAGNPSNVTAATGISLSLKTGSGTLAGTLTGTIANGANQVTISGVTYTKAEIGVVITATRTSGDNLASSDSVPFTVNPGAASKVAFVIQPGNTPNGTTLSGPPAVAVQDSQGNTISTSSATITVAIGTNPGGGTLSGTTTRNAVSGVATFTGLSINQVGNGYTLTGAATGLTGATSSTFNVTGAGTIAGTITRSSDSSPVGGGLVEALQAGGVARSAISAANGSYTLSNLGAGSFSVRVTAGGYTTQTQSGVTVTAGSTTTTNFSLVASGTAPGVVYGYDELGRLRGVVSPAGEAARYAYDAVGNITSITRFDSTQVSVVEFSPNSGAVGSTVAIYGTGFSSTPNQNGVVFNGVPALVTSSTSTQIVTTVPAGATTGSITVSTATSSATSNETFTVMSAGAAPTVTGFSSTVVAVGASVTISGTNFQTPAAANSVRFGGMWAVPSTATSTSIGVTVPATANSGKVSVTTGFGTGTSSGDLFVVRAPNVAADVVQTGRMVIGGATFSVSIATANKVALIVFDGNAGENVGLGINASNTVPHDMEVRGPQGNIIMPNGAVNRNSNINLALTATGTHTIKVTASTSAASMDLTLSTDVNAGTLVADGPTAVPITISRVGQRGYLTFTGTAGQKLGLGINSRTPATFGNRLFVYGPSGALIGSIDDLIPDQQGGSFNNLHMQLSATGIYKVLLDPHGSHTGTATFTLSQQIEAGPLTTSGGSVNVNITRVGQRARVTFDGTTGQRVSIGFTQVTGSNDVTTATFGPTGTAVSSGSSTSTTANHHMVLPSTGTYSIYVDPNGISTASVTMILSDEINGGTLTINGSAVPVTISRVGQRARYSFGLRPIDWREKLRN